MTQSRILVVDDDPKLSELVHFFLKKTGRFNVCVENRSAHALETARKFSPDIVLLDVDMPGKDGGDVQREIKSEPALRHTQIVYLTSLVAGDGGTGEATLRGGTLFLAKPFNPKVLIATLDRMLAGEMARA